MDTAKEKKEEPKKGVHPQPLPLGGLRRSRRLLSRPSPQSYYGGSRKRPRRQLEDTLEGTRKEVHIHIGNPSVQVEEHLPPKEGAVAEGSEAGGTNVAVPGGSPEDPIEVEEHEAHPCLFNEDVLDMIFKHLLAKPGISKDAQNCRLVCKTWKDSVTRLYRQREWATATFYDSNQPRKRSWQRKPLSEFVDTMRSSVSIPVQKFIFGDSFFRHPDPRLFGDFLRLCGPEALSLAITIQSGDAEKILVSVKDVPDLCLSSLKSLQFHTFDDNYGEPDQYKIIQTGQIHGIVKLLDLLLNAAGTLGNADLSYTPSRFTSLVKYQHLVGKQLGGVIACRIPRALKTLRMRMKMSESNFNALGEAGLKLEKFELGIPFVIGSRALYKFLQSQVGSLTHMDICNNRQERNGSQPFIQIQFPRMDEVTYLELSHIAVDVANGSDFATTFPKLNALDLLGMENKDCLSALLSSVKKPSPTLKVLHLPRWVRYNSPLTPFIKKVGESFPFLSELRIYVYSSTRETLQEVFKYFDNLESLDITFADEVRHVDDSYFLGITGMDCYRIRWSRNFHSINLNEFERFPSILNLTKLKKLVVRKDPNCQIIFTDVSAHFVFLEMDKLREIHLTNAEVKFSPGYAELLKDKLIPGERNQNEISSSNCPLILL